LTISVVTNILTKQVDQSNINTISSSQYIFGSSGQAPVGWVAYMAC